jgi:signal transduction histidine kinase
MFGKGDHAETPLDMNDLIRETIALARTELSAAGILVHLDLNPKLPLLTAHRSQLQQVLLNVVINATDAMRTVGDRARMLRIESRSLQSNALEVDVTDSGAGIDPKNIERVFDPFFTTKSTGMGMGLAICRSIVEAHGGALSVSPGSPHGSVFSIVLPINR